MALASQHGSSTSPHTIPRTFGSGYLFGVPLGDLGLFTSLLMSFALGFAAFFASTFCAIIGFLIYNTSSHHRADYALTYEIIGLPVGSLVLVLSLAYLGTMWFRRHSRKQ